MINDNDRDTARLEDIRFIVNHHEYPMEGETGVNMENDPSIVTVLSCKKDADKVRN